MRIRLLASTLLLTVIAGSLPAQSPPADDEQPFTAQHAMVVTIHHCASDAGLAVLKQGGNAADAAVAVGFALAVVYPQAGNIGGGGFMLLRMHTGETHFVDYRERAPRAATASMYLDADGKVIPGLSTEGYKAVGVPGTVAGLTYAEAKFGRLGLKKVMAPAIALARDGYVLTAEEARSLERSRSLAKSSDSRRIFQRDGKFYHAGETFRQPHLARTLERIAADPEDFYKGELAKELAAAVQKGGGLITTADLAGYEPKERTPLQGDYRGVHIITAPPPSSGGVVMLEALNILSGFDLPKMGDRTPEQVHYITEALRRAFMDRADYLGDPDYAPMPIAQMESAAYAAAWRKSIDPIAPSPSATLKRPAGFLPPAPAAKAVHESKQTTHFSVVDAEGNVVANTYTLNDTFGSGVTVGSLGFLLNDEMDDFTSAPAVPNMYGLIQSAANAIAPGKRPLSAMTPTMVLRDGRPLLVLGSPGGPTIISTVLNDLISVVDNRLNVQQAADAPRFHHQYLPDVLQVEKAFPQRVVEKLRSAGYTVRRSGEADEHSAGVWGDSELIYIDPKTGLRMAGHDHRHSFGSAAGY
jgi:gamma-glutamyltranspeptidase/glutathione hydrolase